MGYGGSLIWSGLAKNIKLAHPEKKIIFVYKKRLRDFFTSKKNNDLAIYNNNDDIFLVIDNFSWLIKKPFFHGGYFKINIDRAPYCEKVFRDRLIYRSGGHVIELLCLDYGIEKVVVETKLVLTDKETKKADEVMVEAGLSDKKFVCVEPNSKKSFTTNREWSWDNWQSLTKKIKSFIKENKLEVEIVQVGAEGGSLLNDVVDLRGKTSFRETKRILEKSLFFITTEGGLAHLAASIPKKSFVLISARSPKDILAYPFNVNFYSEVDCKNCGLIKPCPVGLKCMKLITVDAVHDEIKRELKRTFKL